MHKLRQFIATCLVGIGIGFCWVGYVIGKDYR